MKKRKCSPKPRESSKLKRAQAGLLDDMEQFCILEMLHQYNPKSMYELTERLLKAWEDREIQNWLITSQDPDLGACVVNYGQTAVGFIKRVNDLNRIYKKTIANAWSLKPKEQLSAILLALSHIYPHPRRNEMLKRMAEALDKRDHRFFSKLVRKLRAAPKSAAELDNRLMRLASKYWLTPYRCGDGTEIPPIIELADDARLNFLIYITGREDLTSYAMRKALKRARLPEWPLPEGRKQRSGKTPSVKQLLKVRPEV